MRTSRSRRTSAGGVFSEKCDRVADDSYLTLATPAEAALRERSSKFLAFAWPVRSEEEIRIHLETLRKRYYDATHHVTLGVSDRTVHRGGQTTTVSPRGQQANRFSGSCCRGQSPIVDSHRPLFRRHKTRRPRTDSRLQRGYGRSTGCRGHHRTDGRPHRTGRLSLCRNERNHAGSQGRTARNPATSIRQFMYDGVRHPRKPRGTTDRKLKKAGGSIPENE